MRIDRVTVTYDVDGGEISWKVSSEWKVIWIGVDNSRRKFGLK